MTTLNIVNLYEKNSITRLNKEYENKFIKKIKENFNEEQQKMYISNLYCYLNYNIKTDYVIELEKIWHFLGFSRKEHCKVVLEKHFELDIDYKTETIKPKLPENSKGGRPKLLTVMTVNTFKKLCLKSNTKKADEIHDYYIKLEEIFHEIINEETDELRMQLEKTKKDNILDKHNILFNSYDNRAIVYLIKFNDYDNLYKFGSSNNIKSRFLNHKNNMQKNINLIYCIESKNNFLLETSLKQWLKITNYQTEKTFNNHKYTELIEIDNINIIINKIEELNENLYDNKVILELQQNNIRLNKEILILKEENTKLKNAIKSNLSTDIISTDINYELIFKDFIISNLQYNHRSRLMYPKLINLFSNYITNETNNINIILNNELHDNLFNYIREHFNLNNNNKSCIKDITIINHKKYYDNKIYKKFIDENIIIKNRDKDKDNKTYLYKVSVETVYDKFIEFTKTNNIEYKEKKKEYSLQGIKNELRDKIRKITNSILSVINQKIEPLRCYIGIILK